MIRIFNKGFSLIEVLLSISILSIAVVSLLSLIPVGLIDYRQAKFSSVESFMADSVLISIATSSQPPSSSLKYFFDREGSFCDPKEAVYTATIQLQDTITPPNREALQVTLNIINLTDKKQSKTLQTFIVKRNFL